MNRHTLASNSGLGGRIAGLMTSGILVTAAFSGCGDSKSRQTERDATGTGEPAAVAGTQAQTSLPQTSANTPAAPAAEPAKILPGEVTFAEAESAFRGKRYGDAVELFTAYTERKPDNAWGHYMLGLSAWKAGQPEKAEPAFERALQLDPKHVKSLLNWSRVLLEENKPEDALPKIEAALAIDPKSTDGYRLLGRAHAAQGNEDAAIEAYRHAIALDERDAWSMNNLGLVCIEAGRATEALPALARATQLRSDVPTFQNNLGMALEQTGHFQAAATAYRTALAEDADYAKAAVSLARVGTLAENPALGSIDLAVLADQFVVEVRGWGQPALSQAPAASADDSTLASRPVAPATPAPQEENR
jgi:tetratricopeptide (TPR) repeat protein